MPSILIVPDSFKGALSSSDAADAIAAGVASVLDATITTLPVADGGEGTVAAMLGASGGRRVEVPVTSVFPGERIIASYGVIDERIAVIEAASCAGLPLAAGREDTAAATTAGVGEQIAHAVGQGLREIIVGAGGSATTDGGTGAAAALGVRFLDAAGAAFAPTGASLAAVDRIDASAARRLLAGVRLTVMCDIDNPLVGATGAAHVFGPQKGAGPHLVRELDAGLRHLASRVRRDLGADIEAMPGAGAAGGLAGGLHAFAGAQLRPGIELVLEAAGFAELAREADLIITGEGRIDGQSLAGKVPVGVARQARSAGSRAPVVVLAGAIADDVDRLHETGITAIFPIGRGPQNLSSAMASTGTDLRAAGEAVARLFRALVDRS